MPHALHLRDTSHSVSTGGLQKDAPPKTALYLFKNKQEAKQTYLLLLQMQQFYCAYFSARVTT